MVPNKRQDEHKLIAAFLNDIHMSHGVVFNTRSLRLTLKKVESRLRSEGFGFLTKTLPRLGKALDKALASQTPLSATALGFKPQRGSELPIFMGEFFSRVLHPTGTVLPDACADSIRVIRDFCYLFYKYELPYSAELEQNVIDKFVKTESDISNLSGLFESLTQAALLRNADRPIRLKPNMAPVDVVREARILLYKVFQDFDFRDIVPSHGPGAVATRQQLWSKYEWTNVSSRIRQKYPLDEYFYTSLTHVADSIPSLNQVKDEDLPARVILVPKDSRGPRLISCEPVDYQWIQQGIMRRLVQHIEELELTKFNVFFTNQQPNQFGALLGSRTGRYVTLDLNEASDRVSVGLVRLLFPPHVCEYLECCRSSATVLPNGKVIPLQKFAPMGSALCFPILALTVWAILTAAAPDADTRESILVYGDDVIAPSAYAVNAIEQLETFGLKVNRDKSCTAGFFRESCGTDAFKGASVTPVRLRTPWSSSPSPEVYTSWIAYANAMHARKYFNCYDQIVRMLHLVYGAVPAKDMQLACPSLVEVPEYMRPRISRTNRRLQKRQWRVLDIKAPIIRHEMPGWSMLLRFFTEGARPPTSDRKPTLVTRDQHLIEDVAPFSVRSYTRRKTSKLVMRWR